MSSWNARGGWDAVSFEGNDLGAYDMTTSNARGVPRLSSDEDNATTGIRNYAHVGHGGFDANHRNTDTTQSWNRSGKNGEGIGTWGPSDISITAGGDIISRAAMVNTVGPGLLERAILGRNGVTNEIEYYDQFGNIVELSATVRGAQRETAYRQSRCTRCRPSGRPHRRKGRSNRANDL